MTVNPYRPAPRRGALEAPTRERSWRVELLDRDENTLGFVGDASTSADGSGVVSWTVTANDESQVGLSGSLKVRGDLAAGGVPVDWSLHRFRIWEVVTGVGEWPLGVLLPAIPSPQHSWRVTSWDVELVGKLRSMARDRLTQAWQAAAGAPVTGYLVQRLQDAGEFRRAVTPSTAGLPENIVWAAGTSGLTLANELAGAIGYRGLRADPTGVVRAEPYTAPGARPVAWEFEAGAWSLLTPDWSEEWNLDAPNVFLGRSQELDGVVLEATAEDWSPDRPSSIARRGGQRVTEVAEGVEVATLEALQAYVDRRLSELVSPAQRMEVAHLGVPTVPLGDSPGLWVGSVVRHRRPGVDATAVVESMTWTSDSPLCSATWRRI